MNRSRVALVALNVVGGLAVLASYALAFSYSQEVRAALWGGLPRAWRPLYTANMFLAAAGYFPFTFQLVLRTEPAVLHRSTGCSYAWLLLFYGLILVPSALWLPLTAGMIQAPDPGLWYGIRAVLLLVAVGSGGVLYLVVRLALAEGGFARWLAVAGAIPFFFQTAVLDALIWPTYFP